ncbi:MAG: ABC transporter ATP-binding protein [Erysipelotrichaceae bacterium]
MVVVIVKVPDIIMSYNTSKGFWSLIVKYIVDYGNEESIVIDGVDNIKISNLSFGYDSAVLNNISFDLVKNDFVLIKGESGCGKSTLVKLIGKVIKQQGMISVNGVSLEDITFKSYYKYVSFLSQKAVILNKNIEENITLNKEGDLSFALEFVNLKDMVDKFDNGVYTSCNNLSDGEKQKIALARAIYQNKDVLILDEALSAMDEYSRRAIAGNLLKYASNGKIVIVVSHEKEVEDYANKTVLLSKGDL